MPVMKRESANLPNKNNYMDDDEDKASDESGCDCSQDNGILESDLGSNNDIDEHNNIQLYDK